MNVNKKIQFLLESNNNYIKVFLCNNIMVNEFNTENPDAAYRKAQSRDYLGITPEMLAAASRDTRLEQYPEKTNVVGEAVPEFAAESGDTNYLQEIVDQGRADGVDDIEQRTSYAAGAMIGLELDDRFTQLGLEEIVDEVEDLGTVSDVQAFREGYEAGETAVDETLPGGLDPAMGSDNVLELYENVCENVVATGIGAEPEALAEVAQEWLYDNRDSVESGLQSLDHARSEADEWLEKGKLGRILTSRPTGEVARNATSARSKLSKARKGLAKGFTSEVEGGTLVDDSMSVLHLPSDDEETAKYASKNPMRLF